MKVNIKVSSNCSAAEITLDDEVIEIPLDLYYNSELTEKEQMIINLQNVIEFIKNYEQ